MTTASFAPGLGAARLARASELFTEPPVGHARARHHERRLLLASHPVAAGIAEIARAFGPVTSFPILGHVVNDPTVGRAVLADPERFSKTGPGSVSAVLTEVFGPHALLNMDGAPHRALRGRLGALFTPRFVHGLVAEVFERTLADARDRLASGVTVDLVALARILVGRMVAAMLAVELPKGHEDATCLALYDLGVELGSVISVTSRKLGKSRVAFARKRLDELTAHTRASYDRGEENTVPGRLRSLGLTFEETRGVVGVLFLAGMETTASAIPRIVALLVDSGLWNEVRRDRSLVSRAMDEGLRLTTPVPLMTRSVTRPTTLEGKRLRTDDRVIVFLHDVVLTEAFGAEPRELRLDRTYARELSNLWFGHGPHFCLGFSLARREIELTLDALLDAGDLAVASRAYGRRVLFPSYAKLEVRASS